MEEDPIITDENEDEATLINLTQKVEALEKEKLELGNQNKQVKEKIKNLTLQVDQLRNKEDEAEPEPDEWEDDNAVLESLASRSADLENEVFRLQHDLITSMREIDEANKEAVDLKRGLEEKEAVIESLEKEMDDLKKEKMEIERKERDMERRLGILQVREIGERSRNVRTEEEMKEKIDGLQKKVEALEAEAARTGLELEKTNAETLEFEERALMLEFNISELKKVVERKKSEGNKETSTVKAFKACLFRITAGSAAVLFAAAVAYLFRRK
ncbi:peroxisomal and mitochondrial division factor 2-like [Hibiscus syriacus]|uniref:peroxisomal and mitochondrial division factor 2-like n=1 Tax=Hibiscus syriacus TaxID=106335 RepID=UPI001922E382|nr:peroxisomal and mitochondrial division factor 2-like [Hibiscus syriacus]